MKILEIMNDVRSDLFTQEMINRTLNKALYGDDYINSKSFILIKVKLENIDDYKSFLYRRLWETVYMKSSHQYSFILDAEEDTAILKISLSEAISLIQQLTPPVLKKKLGEFTCSIDHICTVLKDFLFDENAGEYYRSVFIKSINFNEFPYVSNYDFTRTKNLMQMTGKSEVCDVIASTVSIRNIINLDSNIGNCSITFVATVKDPKQLCCELNNHHHITSINVNGYGISVRIVASVFQIQFNKFFVEKIRNTYNHLLG